MEVYRGFSTDTTLLLPLLLPWPIPQLHISAVVHSHCYFLVAKCTFWLDMFDETVIGLVVEVGEPLLVVCLAR
jgi:hypothetical protein